MKAKTLLELCRNHGRHPRKLIMNLAYDPCSVNPLWEEAVDRWGEPAVELQGPTRVQEVLAYWDEAGDIPAVTPPMPCSPRDVGDEVTQQGETWGTWGPERLSPQSGRGRAPPSSSQRWGDMAANPHVYGGRWKQAWKVKNKLQWRAQRQTQRQGVDSVRQGSGCQEGTSEGTQ